MLPLDKKKYQLMVVRKVQQQWEQAVIYENYEKGYEKWLNTYLEALEASECYEQLQAFLDYHRDENPRQRKL